MRNLDNDFIHLDDYECLHDQLNNSYHVYKEL